MLLASTAERETELSNDKQKFEYAGRIDPGQAAEYLQSIARQVRSGQLRLSAGPESIDLHMAQQLKLELAAEVKQADGKGSLEIEISWKRPPHFEEPLRVDAAEESTSEDDSEHHEDSGDDQHDSENREDGDNEESHHEESNPGLQITGVE